jgi:mono/diheme cytochrome c family protein
MVDGSVGRFLLLAAMAAGGAGCDPRAPPAAASGPGASAIAQGEVLYDRHCASCHGADLAGQPDWRTRRTDGKLPAPPHDAAGHTWHHSMEQLFRITRNGMKPPDAPPGYVSDMPAFAGVMSDAEIRAVLAYIESRWPEEVVQARRQRFGSGG